MMPQGIMWQAAAPPTQPPQISFAVRQAGVSLVVPRLPQSIESVSVSEEFSDLPARTTRANAAKTSAKAGKKGGK